MLSQDTLQALLQAEVNKILAITLLIGLPGLIALLTLIIRWRSGADQRRDEAKRERERTIAEEARQRSEATSQLAHAIVEQNKHFGVLVETVARMQDGADVRQRQTEKQQKELVDQGDTLDDMQALMVSHNKHLQEHREEAKPVREAVTKIPERLEAINADLAVLKANIEVLPAVKANVEALPESVKDGLKPVLDRLTVIEAEAKRLSDEVHQMRTDITAAIDAAVRQLKPVEPVIVVSEPVVETAGAQ